MIKPGEVVRWFTLAATLEYWLESAHYAWANVDRPSAMATSSPKIRLVSIPRCSLTVVAGASSAPKPRHQHSPRQTLPDSRQGMPAYALLTEFHH